MTQSILVQFTDTNLYLDAGVPVLDVSYTYVPVDTTVTGPGTQGPVAINGLDARLTASKLNDAVMADAIARAAVGSPPIVISKYDRKILCGGFNTQ